MLISGYFVIEARKGYYGEYRGNLRFVKTKPSLNSKEIAIEAKIDVPDVFFERLIPTIEIKVPATAAIQPSIETTVNVTASAVGEALNIEVGKVEDVLTQLVEERQAENA